MRIVMKFGGTSMAGAEKIRGSAKIALDAARAHQVVTVVSAMDGVTEQLLDLAQAAAGGENAEAKRLLTDLRSSHEAAARELDAARVVGDTLAKLEHAVMGVHAAGALTARLRDGIVAFGEVLAAQLMGGAMKCPAMEGQEAGIVTDDRFGEADPLMETSMLQVRRTIEPMLARGQLVVTGFIAANQHGVRTTIGRGGSDYTATILGAALKADEVWIWSDVDGLLTADPRVVRDARLLTHIGASEAVEMGKFGAKSMHPRALEPAAQYRLRVRMRNTFKPEGAGTLITADAPVDAAHPVRAAQALKKMALITVGGAGMVGRPGTAAAMFDALATARVNVHMISQSVSEAGISVVVGSAQADQARAALQRALLPAGYARTIDVLDGVSIVAIIGPGMKGTPGIAARAFAALADAKVNLIAIAQGSSELSISVAVLDSAGADAVRALHAAFDLGSPT